MQISLCINVLCSEFRDSAARTAMNHTIFNINYVRMSLWWMEGFDGDGWRLLWEYTMLLFPCTSNRSPPTLRYLLHPSKQVAKRILLSFSTASWRRLGMNISLNWCNIDRNTCNTVLIYLFGLSLFRLDISSQSACIANKFVVELTERTWHLGSQLCV